MDLSELQKMQNLSQNEHEQIAKMQNLSQNEQEQIAKMRRIKNYKKNVKKRIINYSFNTRAKPY